MAEHGVFMTRVVTWNTWWCFGPWQERQPLLTAAVAAQQADVVLLQETWPEQAEAVAQACGLAVIELSVGPFEPSGTDTEPAGTLFGNAILGRADQTEAMGSTPLSSAGDGAPRNGLAVRHRGEGPALLLVATHLNHIAEASSVRSQQLDLLRQWIDQLWPQGPVVLGGDLNLVPTSEEYHRSIAPRWVDLWRQAKPGEPGSTMVPENPRFRDIDWMAARNGPGTPAGVRFDYLLARRGPEGSSGLSVKAIDVIGGAEHGWPSDHLGLVADVSIVDHSEQFDEQRMSTCLTE